jgi:hypothetical protein
MCRVVTYKWGCSERRGCLYEELSRVPCRSKLYENVCEEGDKSSTTKYNSDCPECCNPAQLENLGVKNSTSDKEAC